MVVCHHQLDGHGFGWTLGAGDGHLLQMVYNVLFLSYSQHLFCVFLIVVILTVMKRCLTMILICISVMFSNVQDHLLYLLTISIFSLGKYIINVFVHFLVRWTALNYWVTKGSLLASWDTLGPFSSTSLQQRECWNKGGHINIFLF